MRVIINTQQFFFFFNFFSFQYVFLFLFNYYFNVFIISCFSFLFGTVETSCEVTNHTIVEATCYYDCNCYWTSTVVYYYYGTGYSSYEVCESCPYTCYDGFITVDYEIVDQSPTYTISGDEVVANGYDFYSDVESYLEDAYPVGSADVCWYHSDDVYDFRYSYTNGSGFLIAAIILLAFGILCPMSLVGCCCGGGEEEPEPAEMAASTTPAAVSVTVVQQPQQAAMQQPQPVQMAPMVQPQGQPYVQQPVQQPYAQPAPGYDPTQGQPQPYGAPAVQQPYAPTGYEQQPAQQPYAPTGYGQQPAQQPYGQQY